MNLNSRVDLVMININKNYRSILKNFAFIFLIISNLQTRSYAQNFTKIDTGVVANDGGISKLNLYRNFLP
jgi:hypothetical protein